MIYLFQCSRQSFTKISFDDMMVGNRLERDVDGDGNFEILTINFSEHEGNSYCTYNLFELSKRNLVNVNHKIGYPVIELCMEPESPEITETIPEEKLARFVLAQPINYDKGD